METSDLEIPFRLTPLEIYEQRNRERPVSWFDLTAGEYAVRVGEQHVFELEDDRGRGWVQYPVVRLWEDVLDVLPDALSPVPPDLARRLEPDAQWDRWDIRARSVIARCSARERRYELELARDWCVRRTLQVAHLGAAPRLTFVSAGGRTVVTCEPWPEPTPGTIRWRCEPARVELPTRLFVAEVARFGRALVDAMGTRIEAVAAGAIDGRAVVDVGALREQHARRETMLAATLARGPNDVEDWDRIRRAIQMVEDASQD